MSNKYKHDQKYKIEIFYRNINMAMQCRATVYVLRK